MKKHITISIKAAVLGARSDFIGVAWDGPGMQQHVIEGPFLPPWQDNDNIVM